MEKLEQLAAQLTQELTDNEITALFILIEKLKGKN